MDCSPNVFQVLSHRPLEFRAFFAYYNVICNKKTGQLSRADKELIILVTSLGNRCSYSVVVHSAWYRVFSKNPVLSDQVNAHLPVTVSHSCAHLLLCAHDVWDEGIAKL